MKTLQNYILLESKNFNLTQTERDALDCVIGFATGNLGEKSDIQQFDKFNNELSEEEKQILLNLHDTIEDNENYPKLTKRNLLDEEIILIDKIINYIERNDIKTEFDYELSNIQDKIKR